LKLRANESEVGTATHLPTPLVGESLGFGPGRLRNDLLGLFIKTDPNFFSAHNNLGLVHFSIPLDRLDLEAALFAGLDRRVHEKERAAEGGLGNLDIQAFRRLSFPTTELIRFPLR
jgi:hypothetical protein